MIEVVLSSKALESHPVLAVEASEEQLEGHHQFLLAQEEGAHHLQDPHSSVACSQAECPS